MPNKETWRDWMPPDMPEPAEGDLITRGELLQRLRDRNVVICPRTLQLWESMGIVPRPIRRWNNGGPRALYPPWDEDLVIIADKGRGNREDIEKISQNVKDHVRYAAGSFAMQRYPVSYRLVDCLRDVAHAYDAAGGVSVSTARLVFSDEKGDDAFGITIDFGLTPTTDR